MTVEPTSPPARAIVRRRISGFGFCNPNVSPPQMVANRLGERQCVEEAHREPLELVGADRQPAAMRGERVQRGLEAGKWPRLIRDVRGVVVDEVAHHPVDLDHVERAALRFQPAHDQRPRAATDHVAGCIIGNGRQAGASENDVEGGDEIGRAVDQRAVEIQNDGRSHHPRIAIC